MGDRADGGRTPVPTSASPRWWRWGWPLLLLGMAAAVPLLVWLGWSAISNSSDGTEVGTPIDPAEPGYEAFVDPTPTLLLIHANGDRLHGVTLLVLTDPGVEGAVVIMAPETATSRGLLSGRWADSGSAGLADSVAELLGIRPDEWQVVGNDGWGALVSAVAPVGPVIPAASAGSEEQARSGGGLGVLAASDVGPYLAERGPGESPIVGLSRHESFWQAWLEQVGESTAPDVIPGETDRGMGRFARSLAAGRYLVITMGEEVADSGVVVLAPAQTASLVRELIPFPVSVADANSPRVRLLNGHGEAELTKAAARALSRAGARIAIIGNAAEFGWQNTEVAYHSLGFAGHAEAYRDALGAGSVVAEEPTDPTIDITVTFGADFSQLVAGGG